MSAVIPGFHPLNINAKKGEGGENFVEPQDGGHEREEIKPGVHFPEY